MNGPARDWLPILHPDDRDRFKATLDAVIEHRRGRISQDFRVRGDDGHYHWMNLHSRPVLGSDGEVVRCVGTLKDVTGRRKSEERLLHDALHDQLTGLPNRELLLDRLDALAALIGSQIDMRPTVFVIDLDDFGRINEAYGVVTGDTVLLTVARRLRRVLKPQDSLARLDADRFAIILNSRTDIAEVAAFAEFLRGVIRAPIGFTDTEIGLTGSIGLTGWTEGAGAEGRQPAVDEGRQRGDSGGQPQNGRDAEIADARDEGDGRAARRLDPGQRDDRQDDRHRHQRGAQQDKDVGHGIELVQKAAAPSLGVGAG